MYRICVMELQFETPIKCYQGRSCKFSAFKLYSSTVLPLLALFLFSDCFVICDEISMVSVPLGFEISGFDKTNTWVSQNGVFAFGFLEACQKDDGFDGFVAGVRYNLGDNVANVPVWTIGGGLRVPVNSTIRLSMDGRLILFENSTGLIVWSSNTSNSGVKKASLLNNGNLVLMDFGDNVLWESFDSPTSTLLPGQSLHFPQTLRAPSKKTISSYYSFVIRQSGELALVWENNVTYWRASLNPFSDVEEVAFGTNGVLRLVGSRNRTIWSAVSGDFDDPLVVIRRLRMDLDGNLRMYSWDHTLSKWKVAWQAVENQCDVFGSCGLYSLCGFNSTGPVCDCLYQDSTSFGSSFDLRDSGGFECKRMVDLGNCRMNASMIILEQTVLYGLYPPLDVDMKLSEEECKDYCDSDSTCIATTSKNDGSGICTIKRTSFISGYRSPSVAATSFIKVCFVPLAVAAHGVDPNVNAKKNPGSSEELGRKNNFAGTVVLILFVTIVGFVTMEVFVFWFFYRNRKFKVKLRVPFGKDAEMSGRYSVLIRLSYEEIKELTSDFADQLGPSTFKGVLSNKVPVTAKLLTDVTVDERDFRVAISTLGNIYHRHLVTLKGFCFEEDHKFILYEYVHNGSLDNWLFTNDLDQNGRKWQQRLEIALGIARGLAYLHSECQTCIAHGNLKLENILLDENLVPKLADFGLRSLFLNKTSTSSETPSERDIYMFGQMLLQLVTLKHSITSEDTHHLLNKICEELHTEDTIESGMERVVKIALWCMQIQPFLRPSIGEVVKVLEGTISVDRPPLGFGFRRDDGDEIVQHS